MNKRQRKKKTTEPVYIFHGDNVVSPNMWKNGNYRTRLLYKLAVKYGLLEQTREYKL